MLCALASGQAAADGFARFDGTWYPQGDDPARCETRPIRFLPGEGGSILGLRGKSEGGYFDPFYRVTGEGADYLILSWLELPEGDFPLPERSDRPERRLWRNPAGLVCLGAFPPDGAAPDCDWYLPCERPSVS